MRDIKETEGKEIKEKERQKETVKIESDNKERQQRDRELFAQQKFSQMERG